MGSGEVAIVALSTMISLKVTFSDGLGGANSSPRQVTSIISWPIIITPPSKAWASIGEPRRVAPLR